MCILQLRKGKHDRIFFIFSEKNKILFWPKKILFFADQNRKKRQKSWNRIFFAKKIFRAARGQFLLRKYKRKILKNMIGFFLAFSAKFAEVSKNRIFRIFLAFLKSYFGLKSEKKLEKIIFRFPPKMSFSTEKNPMCIFCFFLYKFLNKNWPRAARKIFLTFKKSYCCF